MEDFATVEVLKKKTNEIVYVKIDKEDVEKFNKYNWYASYNNNTKSHYVYHSYKEDGKTQILYLHRYVLDCPIDKVVDHINHDTVDNRKANLRVVTRKENMANMKRGNNYFKLSDDIVKEILTSDKTNKELAEKYEVTPTAIYLVRAGKTGVNILPDIERTKVYKDYTNRAKNKGSIKMYDLNGLYLRTFDDKKQAKEFLNRPNNDCKQMQRALNKECKQAYGYKWSY